MHVSVLIPTFKRARLLGCVLEALRRQTFRDFDVIVVLKPSGDGSEEVVEKYGKWLDVVLVLQRQGFVVDALNLGLRHVSGDVVAFLDDDAIPDINWVKRHVESYENYENVGGVAGNVIPAKLCGGKLVKIKGDASHIIPSHRTLTFFEKVFGRVWSAPLEGMENYLVYISKAGVVDYNLNVSRFAWHRTVRSLLGMGANMSVLSDAIRDFRFPDLWILGLAWEQFLGWHLWKKGYKLIFNPGVCVYHIIGHESLTRSQSLTLRGDSKDLLRFVENNLLFYRLYDMERRLSVMHRIAWIVFSSMANLKNLNKQQERINQMVQLKSKFYSELIGIRCLLLRKVGFNYIHLDMFRKFRKIFA